MLLLADGRTRLSIFTTAPAGYATGDGVLEIPITAFATAIDTAGQINKPDYRLSPTASGTVSDKPLDEEGEGNALGFPAYEGNVTVLRHLTDDGKIDTAADTVFTAIGELGAIAWYAERIGPKARVADAVDDEGWIYEATSDNPQQPQDRTGYIKNPIPLRVNSRRRYKIVAGA